MIFELEKIKKTLASAKKSTSSKKQIDDLMKHLLIDKNMKIFIKKYIVKSSDWVLKHNCILEPTNVGNINILLDGNEVVNYYLDYFETSYFSINYGNIWFNYRYDCVDGVYIEFVDFVDLNKVINLFKIKVVNLDE